MTADLSNPWRSGATLLLIFGCLVLTALPRFNRNQLIVQAPPRDDVQYALYVQFFRGEVSEEMLRPAASWRPLVPFVASFLPGNPMTALSLANLLFLALGLVSLYATLRRLGVVPRQVWVGCLVYAVSFPTFYYATIGYVDPGLMGLIGVGVYLIARGSPLWLFPLLVVATFAKEGSLVLVPAAMAALLLSPRARGRRSAWVLGSLLVPGVWLGTILLVRAHAPGTTSDAFWTPDLGVLVQNALRPRTWVGAVLSFGVPGFLLLARWPQVVSAVRSRPQELLPLLVGAAAAVASWLYAFATAAVDGRSLWTMYPFAIPLLFAAFGGSPGNPAPQRDISESDLSGAETGSSL